MLLACLSVTLSCVLLCSAESRFTSHDQLHGIYADNLAKLWKLGIQIPGPITSGCHVAMLKHAETSPETSDH